MASRVFLHIGAPKTGTTFVQLVMWRNRERLREQGVLYPGRVRMDHFHATVAVREQSFDKHPPHARDAWERLRDESRAWDGTAIISHEFFGAATADQARRAIDALAPAEVHLVFTARDYVRQLAAYWQQALKMRYMGGLSDYTRAALADELTGPWSWRTMDAVAVLERWGQHLPKQRVHVVTVPQPGAPRGLLWQRYASLVGIAPESCDTTLARGNESLGVVEAELLRRVKPGIPAPISTDLQTMYRWQNGYLAQDLLVGRSKERFGLRRGEIAALSELSRSAADELAAAGYHVVGDLGELVPPDEPPDARHPDDVSDSELLDAAVDTIGRLVGDIEKQHRRIVRAEQAARQARRTNEGEGSKSSAGSQDAPRPLRQILIDLSEHRPLLMRARAGYRHTRNVMRRLRGR